MIQAGNQQDKLPDMEDYSRSWYRQRLGGQARPRAHSRYIHLKQEWHERGFLDRQQMNLDFPHPAEVEYVRREVLLKIYLF